MKTYVYRHIVRAPAKTLLGVAVALCLTFMFGFLQNTVVNLNSEIDRIYEETIVYAEVRLAEDFMRTRRVAGDIISTAIVQYIWDMGIVTDIYLEGSSAGFIVTHPYEEVGRLEVLLGVNSLRDLTADLPGFVGREDPFNMEIQFAQNFNENDFADSDIIPIIISQEIAERRNLSAGDNAYIWYYKPVLFREGEWVYIPVFVLGIHDGSALPRIAREGVVIPLSAQRNMFEEHMGYISARCSIDPAYNRELEAIEARLSQAMRSVFTYPRRDRMLVDMWDQELRFGVAPLAQHLALLQLLVPIIAVIVAIIGAGLVMLSMLQNAKNAATIRVLGMPMQKTRAMLWLVQVTIVVGGVLAGVLISVVIGLSVNLLIILPYLTGAIIGATVGVVLITSRTPLELLQVKD